MATLTIRPQRLAMLLLLGISYPGQAQLPPDDHRLVQDRAHVLRPAVAAALEQRLTRYADSSGVQLAVVTWPALHGQAVGGVADSLKSTQGAASRKMRRGILYLVAPAEHRQAIRVGRGLEAALPAGACLRILEDTKPGLAGSVELAVLRRVEAIQRQLRAAAVELAPGPVQEPVPSPLESKRNIPFILFLLGSMGYALVAVRRKIHAGRQQAKPVLEEPAGYLDRALAGKWRQRRSLARREFQGRGRVEEPVSSTSDTSADAALGNYLLSSLTAGRGPHPGSSSFTHGDAAGAGGAGPSAG